jgi:hypothetical protein
VLHARRRRYNDVMQIAIYVLSGFFFLLAAALVFTYARKRQAGLLLMAAAYGGSAGAAIALAEGWPLFAGFAAAWLIRFAGLDPDVKRASRR